MNRIEAAIVAITIGSAAITSAAAAPLAQTPGNWTVYWADERCVLSRQYDQALVIIRTLPANTRSIEFLVADPALAEKKFNRMTLTLFPSAETYSLRAEVGKAADGGPVIAAYGLTHDFLASLARSNRLAATAGAAQIADVKFSAAEGAVEAMNACFDDLMASWGIDVKAWRSLRKGPSANPALFISYADYPAEALRKKESGTTTVRVRVSPEGRITDCFVLISSQSPSLDAQTCRVAIRKARLEPAIGADGKPAASEELMRVTWIRAKD